MKTQCSLPLPSGTCFIRSLEPKFGKVEKCRSAKDNGVQVLIPIMVTPDHVRLSCVLDWILQTPDRIRSWAHCAEDIITGLDNMHTRSVITAKQTTTQVIAPDRPTHHLCPPAVTLSPDGL